MNDGSRVGALVADFLVRHRGQLTRRWLRAVRQHIDIGPLNREMAAGLINQLPALFDDLCAFLPRTTDADEVSMRTLHEARMHASVRWRQGFALDELYLELALLQRCIQMCIREYFAGAPSREGQTAIHDAVEEFFSDATRGAIGQFQAQQDRRVNDALGERDRALAAQLRSDERLRMAAEAAGLGIFEWDPATGAAVWENERMFAITGQPHEKGPLGAEEFLSRLATTEDVARLRNALAAARSSSADVHLVAGMRKTQTGEHCAVEIAGRFMTDATGLRCVLVGTMADVTSRVRAEDALRETDRRKDVFLATLAHELRNPLSPILNAAHVLRRPDPSSQQLGWIQGVVERHAKHLAHLIDDLLDLSRISAGKIHLRKERFDLRTAVERAIEINAPAAAGHRHRLEVAGTQGQPLLVRADPTRITQVLSNLVDNAIKYTADGGHIQIRVHRAPGRVSVSVEDNGIGMEPALIPSMFEMFEQAPLGSRGAKAGLGIGLSVARSLMRMHGGTIKATSAGPGRGSCFTIDLPLLDAPVPRPEKPGPSGGDQALPARRLLIVDDNQDAAMSLAMVLDSHDVRVAATGREALEIARAFRPEMVFLDLGLPDLSGYEVARRLALQPGDAHPVLVALTGYGQPEDREQTRQAGFAHHLVKPVLPEDILGLVAGSGQKEL